MKDGQIDYSGYCRIELMQAASSIDKERYPLNFANLQSALAAAPPMSTASISAEPVTLYPYVGLWPRLGASIVDGIIWLPDTALTFWGPDHWRLFYLYSLVPWLLLSGWYFVHLVKRYGGTPGKLLLRIEIRTPDGSMIGYRNAFARVVVGWALGVMIVIGEIAASLQLSDATYFSLTASERNARFVDSAPHWFMAALALTIAWSLSDAIVMLSNRKRRALHDFIAGTVVVHKAATRAAIRGEPAVLPTN